MTNRRGGRQAGAVPCWAGFAEATGGRTDGQTDGRKGRQAAALLIVIILLILETEGLPGNIMAAVRPSVSRPQRSECSS